jgi:hypothetical protein
MLPIPWWPKTCNFKGAIRFPKAVLILTRVDSNPILPKNQQLIKTSSMADNKLGKIA